MKQIRSLIFASLLTALMSSNSFAFSYDSLNFIGFSEDGKYLAFEDFTASSEAGDGDTWTTYFIDTVKNSFALPPVVLVADDQTSAESKAALRLYNHYKIPAALRKLGIRRGNNGLLVVSHLLEDWSGITPTQSKETFVESDGTKKDVLVSDYQGGFYKENNKSVEKVIFNPDHDIRRRNSFEFYELILKTSPEMIGAQESGAARMELTLQDNTQHQFINPQILQKDADVLPKSRAWSLGYKIERVYVYRDKIAVFINVFGVGYEEAAMSYMVVTGKITGR